MKQLPLSDDQMTYQEWLECEIARRGLAGTEFDWEATIASIIRSAPRMFLGDSNDLLDKDLRRRTVLGFKKMGIRRYESMLAPLEESAPSPVVGVWQNELPFVQFLDLQANRMKQAFVDITAVERDVQEWITAHPEEDITVDGMMSEIRAIASR